MCQAPGHMLVLLFGASDTSHGCYYPRENGRAERVRACPKTNAKLRTGTRTQSTGVKTHGAISTRPELRVGSVYPGPCSENSVHSPFTPTGGKQSNRILTPLSWVCKQHHSDNAWPLSLKETSLTLPFPISCKGEGAGLWTRIDKNLTGMF